MDEKDGDRNTHLSCLCLKTEEIMEQIQLKSEIPCLVTEKIEELGLI